MARVIGIDHLVIRVGDFAKSKRFYNAVLGFLGFKLKYQHGRHAGWSNGKTLFWIGEADARGKRRKHRIGDIGFHHYAFEVGARRDVDDLYKLLKAKKLTVIDPPADYPDYGRGYYAVYFLDPDGLKLEGMFFPKARKKPRKKSAKKR
ncbi:MAG: VOC family protein [Rhodospirillales bacterium]|nr:VOC family protein [Rhodospirillales bacterium]